MELIRGMLKFIFFLWQLPQNILGFIVSKIEKAVKRTDFGITYYATSFPKPLMKHCAVSLGDFIIADAFIANELNLKHENGHQKQSKMLGPFYLLFIGLPSAIGNCIDRVFHKNWETKKREVWYYKQPWEAWADKLGKVERKI